MRRNRPIPFRSKSKFAFVVDGECEFWYINMLKRNERSINVDLKPEIPQRKKLVDQFKKVVELSNDYDKVFWIIDFDVINSETHKTKKGARTALQEFKDYYDKIKKEYKNIIVIINNPCLEFWILLHFETTSRYFNTCEGAITKLERYLPDYEKTQSYYTKQDQDIYLRLKPHLKNALSNANKLVDFDFDNPHSGMTQMQLFFEIEQIMEIVEIK
jgi:hypothetical protein